MRLPYDFLDHKRSTELEMRRVAEALLKAGLILSMIACNTGETEPSDFEAGNVRFLRSSDLPAEVAYSGVPQEGVFSICTSIFSLANGAHDFPFTYTVEVTNSLPSDRYVNAVSVRPGHCVAVFETRRRGGPVPEVVVTATSNLVINGALLYDGRSIAAGYDEFKGFFPAEIIDTPATALEITLRGFDGAVVKVYYQPADPLSCPQHQAADVTVESLCESGGHGGTGTLQFAGS